jgi:hypothetical protein
LVRDYRTKRDRGDQVGSQVRNTYGTHQTYNTGRLARCAPGPCALAKPGHAHMHGPTGPDTQACTRKPGDPVCKHVTCSDCRTIVERLSLYASTRMLARRVPGLRPGHVHLPGPRGPDTQACTRKPGGPGVHAIDVHCGDCRAIVVVV